MTDEQEILATFLGGWRNYQSLLIEPLGALSADELDMGAAPHLRSIGEVVAHMISARARWLQGVGVGDVALAEMSTWDRSQARERGAAELIQGLETTWNVLREAITRWTASEWRQVHTRRRPEDEPYTRGWVVWHLIEHDLHHGGEVSLTLGILRLKAPDL